MFLSLFCTSLELQKFIFVKEVLSALKSRGLKRSLAILNDIAFPYKYYTDEINSGNTGDAYAELTRSFVKQQRE
jgi:hypothetical protein